MRKLLNLTITLMVFSSASYAQNHDRSGTAGPAAAEENVKTRKVDRSFKSLYECMDTVVERDANRRLRVDDDTSAVQIYLTEKEFLEHDSDATIRGAFDIKSMTTTLSDDNFEYSNRAIERMEIGLAHFEKYFSKKAADAIVIGLRPGMGTTASMDLIHKTADGLCRCEKIGISLEKVNAARRSIINNEKIQLRDINNTKRKITAEDLACY